METMLVPFARENPQLEICASLRPGQHPYVRSHYVNDGDKTLSLKNLSAQQVADRLQYMRDARPVPLRKWDKPFRSSPSVQGSWKQGAELDRPHATIRAA